ncbi:MAG TPA: universal stress protein [Solirubrobacteraceae bacterium]|nr:universal stress protein [Solirubrobacteraceae bacterium]
MSDGADTAREGANAARRCLAVGYDRTESSRRAVSWAASQLQPDGKLVIVHAGKPLHAPSSPLSTHSERAELGRAMIDELLLEGDDSLRDLELAAEILDRDPVNALIEAASRHNASAIVIGHERHSRLRRAVGVLTSELLDASPLPVIAIPSAAAPD